MVGRGRLIAGLVVIGVALAWVGTRGLAGNLVYYRTPTEVVADAGAGERMRMGGLVEPGSPRDVGGGIRFIVTDGSTRVTVVGTGDVPALFREGQGVVVEGTYGADGAFHADTVLVRHGSEYRPPSPGVTPTVADLEGS
jgi:cytochrome c-type biogenesis protein CcmE